MRLYSIILFLIASSMAFCADVTGTWKAQIQVENNTMNVTFNFKVDGSQLTGTARSDRGEQKITDGKVEGNEISFVVLTDAYRAVTKGTVSGDEIQMKISVEDRVFEVTAKRS